MGDQNERCTCKFQGRHIGWQQLLTIAKNKTTSFYSNERVRRMEQLEPKHRQDCGHCYSPEGHFCNGTLTDHNEGKYEHEFQKTEHWIDEMKEESRKLRI